MDREAWHTAVHGVAKSRTRLSDWTELNWEFFAFATLVISKIDLWSFLSAAKSLQSCPTLCDPIGGSPLGSPIPGIFQARTLEWVAISFSSASKWKVKVKSLSCVRLLATPWTTAHHAPPSMWFLGKSTGVGCLIINKVSNSSSLWKIYLYLSMCLSVYIFTCPAFKI